MEDQEQHLKQIHLGAFDRIMEQKVGYGLYQKRALLFVSLVDFNDGAELIIMSLMVKILSVEDPSITKSYLELISSLFYLGMFFGALASGRLADYYGRRPTLIVSTTAQGVLAVLFIFIGKNLIAIAFLRTLYGVIYGFSLPISTTMYSEITPMSARGKGIVVINSFVGIGKLWAVFLAWMVLQDVAHGNWRLLTALSSIPCFIVAFCTYNYLEESPRYLVANARYQEGAETLNAMIRINQNDWSTTERKIQTNSEGNSNTITEEDIEELKVWREEKFNDAERGSVKMLFGQEYLQITVKLWVIWMLYHIMSKGQVTILPFILSSLNDKNQEFENMAMAVFGEIPAMAVNYYIIELPQFGRKNTMVIFFIASFFMNIICYYNIALEYSLMGARFCFRVVSSMAYAYTTEIYKTTFRTVGMGWASALGRVGGVVMPYIVLPLYSTNAMLPFAAFAIFSVVCAISAYQLPFDTTARPLDQKPISKQEEQELKSLNSAKYPN